MVGVPHEEAVFKTHPMNFLKENTLESTFFGKYKPHTNHSDIAEIYMRKQLELEKFILFSRSTR